MKRRLLFAASLLATAAAHAQFTITVDSNGSNLANSLVGTGTNIQNVQLTCAGTSSGYFSGPTGQLGIGYGVLLSTGSIELLADSISYNGNPQMGMPGDAYLDTVVNTTTFDACVLEFDVTVNGDTLLIDYVFGSAEYPEYQCSVFNDVFAFQLSGPNPNGSTYENHNIARIPGGDLEVCINNVNDYVDHGMGVCGGDNSMYYVSNDSSTIGVDLDGFTVPLTAKAPTIPGETYHMRFAVADASDAVMDTGIFLKAGSLKSAHAATGIATLGSNTLTSAKPNPTTSATPLLLGNQTGKPIEYAVLNMMGQTLLKGHVGAGATTTIDLSAFGTGHYLVRSSNGAVVTTQRIEVR